jgi:hypothetical protein
MSNRSASLILLLICLLFLGYAWAGQITVPGVCQPSRYVQRGADLLIYCPQQAAPRITVKACRNARVMWNRSAGRVTVTCR